jgi:lysophospholipase L1-like esterase
MAPDGRKLFLFLGACLAGLLLCEAIVRIFHLYPATINLTGFRFTDNTKIVYELVPGCDSGYGYINQQGFRRNGEFQKPKPRGVIRIAMLGDSITQGLFVQQGETFSDQLESILNAYAKRNNSPKRYEVMNAGVSGYNLGAEVEVLKTKILPYAPDVVVVNMFHNDNDPLPNFETYFPEYGDLKQQALMVKRYYEQESSLHKAIRITLRHSKFWLFIDERLRDLKKEKGIVGALRKHHVNDDWGIVPIDEGLEEIKNLQMKYGFKVLVCIHPHLLFWEHPNNVKFEKVAKGYGFPVFCMFDYYRKSGVDPAQLKNDIPNDTCHPTSLGHRIIAEAMFVELNRNHIIDFNN